MFAIDPVPHYRAAQKCHVDANLMRATRQWMDFE